MRNLLLSVAIAVALCGCTAPDTAMRALQGAGYTNIKLGGYAWIGCSGSDDFATKFIATGPSGKRVSGVVCSGILKGATIRTD